MAMGRLQLASHTGTAAKRMLREAETTASLAPSSGAPSLQAGNSAPAPTAFSQMLAPPATKYLDREVAAQSEYAGNAEAETRRTFEFSSLGMFGLNAAEGAQNQTDETIDGAPNAADTMPIVGLKKGDAAQSGQTGLGGAAGVVTDGPIAWSANASYPNDLGLDARALDASESAMTAASVRSAASVSFEAEPMSAAVIADTPTGDETIEIGEGSASAPPPLASNVQTLNAPAVFVFGPDDAAQVTVRMPNAASDAGIIREAIERTAAEYGVRIDELHVNGSVSPSAFSLKGNSRGRNTR